MFRQNKSSIGAILAAAGHMLNPKFRATEMPQRSRMPKLYASKLQRRIARSEDSRSTIEGYYRDNRIEKNLRIIRESGGNLKGKFKGCHA